MPHDRNPRGDPAGPVVTDRLTCGPDDSRIARAARARHAGQVGEPVDKPGSGPPGPPGAGPSRAEPPGAGPSGAGLAGADRHAFEPGRGWHVAFAALAAAAAVLALVGGLSPARQYAALAVLAVACAWYATVGARVLRGPRSQVGLASLYIGVAIPVTVGLALLAPSGGLLFCLLYPHIWTLLPVGRAIAATVLTAAATGAGALAGSGLGAAQLREAGAIAGGSVLVAVVLGLWITRVVSQSKSRAEVIAELAATRTELAELSRQAGAMAERERLARDIHDTLAQGFTSVLLLLEAADAELGPGAAGARPFLRDARQTAAENLAEARAMVAALSPPDLRDASLPAALGQLIDRLGREPGPAVGLTVTGPPRPLAANEEVVLLRATQEALTNARKHADARQVSVELAYRPGAVALRITDDGRGFDPAAGTAGFGLAGMRARVAQVDGAMLVRAAPGAGTTIAVDLPVARSAAPDGPGPAPGPARSRAAVPAERGPAR
jgi:signal transduction histidine kinase